LRPSARLAGRPGAMVRESSTRDQGASQSAATLQRCSSGARGARPFANPWRTNFLDGPRGVPDGRRQLHFSHRVLRRKFTLLVLWRGSPGWFTRGSGHSGSSGGGGGFGESRGFQRFSYGGLSFELQFDWTAASVKLLDREVSLRETNFIFVDNVDVTSGPVLVEARRIDVPRELGNEIDAIRIFINRSPELYGYLQCDKQLPDPPMQAMIAIICDQMRPR
jgi:hypothetical protein